MASWTISEVVAAAGASLVWFEVDGAGAGVVDADGAGAGVVDADGAGAGVVDADGAGAGVVDEDGDGVAAVVALAVMGALIPRRLIETIARRATVRERTSVRSRMAGADKAAVSRLLFVMPGSEFSNRFT